MSHDDVFERLCDFLDGSLEESERRSVSKHLEQCASCRSALKDLESIRMEVRALPVYEPSEEVWSGIHSRLGQKASRSAGAAVLPWLALAAALVLAAGLWILVQEPTAAPEDQEELVTRVTEELRAAETHYQNAIDGLEQIITRNEGVLSPELNAVLEENLDLIENAIEESRQAISVEPGSTVAQESLLTALRRKVSLLQNTILLINEVRKGEGANALDLIEEIREDSPSPDPI